jgi:hydrogenase maturation protease
LGAKVASGFEVDLPGGRTLHNEVVIIGCGNLLRGDDAAGPLLVRKIAELGTPPGVRLVDGGTAGIDVALEMAGADEVFIVDACTSGSGPGEIFELSGDDLAVPPPGGMNLHALRWDSAIAFARWQLKDRYPKRVTVILIEAAGFELGAPPSVPVRDSIEAVARALIARFPRVAGPV